MCFENGIMYDECMLFKLAYLDGYVRPTRNKTTTLACIFVICVTVSQNGFTMSAGYRSTDKQEKCPKRCTTTLAITNNRNIIVYYIHNDIIRFYDNG